MKSQSQKKPPVKLAHCDLLCDVYRLEYDEHKNRMLAGVMMAPGEMRRLLESLTEFYATSKTKRGKRICELAKELADLVFADCKFFLRGTAHVAPGKSVLLSTDREEFQKLMDDLEKD